MPSRSTRTEICANCKRSEPGCGYTVFQKDVIDKEYQGSPLPGQTQYKVTWRSTPLIMFICDGCLRHYRRELVVSKSIPLALFVLSVCVFLAAGRPIRGLSGIGIAVFGIWGFGNLRVLTKSSYGVLLAARTARRDHNLKKGVRGTRLFCESDSQYDHTEAPY